VTNSFRLSGHAERDVLDIYLHTLKHFGPAQADRHTSDLFARLEAIAAQPTLGRDFGDIHPGARRANQQSHAIYFRPDADGILILRILHQKMDPARTSAVNRPESRVGHREARSVDARAGARFVPPLPAPHPAVFRPDTAPADGIPPVPR
jgi:toxin ParE1/3/4